MSGQEGGVGRFWARNCGVGDLQNRALPGWGCLSRSGALAVQVPDHQRKLHVREGMCGKAQRRSYHKVGPDRSGRPGRARVRLLHEAPAYGLP
eukprot:7716506-Pyramimonas_sp.AAC.1